MRRSHILTSRGCRLHGRSLHECRPRPEAPATRSPLQQANRQSENWQCSSAVSVNEASMQRVPHPGRVPLLHARRVGLTRQRRIARRAGTSAATAFTARTIGIHQFHVAAERPRSRRSVQHNFLCVLGAAKQHDGRSPGLQAGESSGQTRGASAPAASFIPQRRQRIDLHDPGQDPPVSPQLQSLRKNSSPW
jgi:hypothetical protein